MQLLPRHGGGPARSMVFDSARYFLVPGLLDRSIRSLEAVEQRVGQRRALINGKCERPFQKIGHFWTHGFDSNREYSPSPEVALGVRYTLAGPGLPVLPGQDLSAQSEASASLPP